MTARTVGAWILAAVLGLVLAVAITLAASQLSSQRVGLSGEPASAGDQLVPSARHRTAPRQPSQPPQPSNGDEARETDGDD
jgi:hypothetical protein